MPVFRTFLRTRIW